MNAGEMVFKCVSNGTVSETDRWTDLFLLSGFSFTNIRDSQDSRGRGRLFHYFFSTTSSRFIDSQTLAGQEFTAEHKQQPESNLEPLLSERKSGSEFPILVFKIYECSQLVSLSENTRSSEKTSTSNLNSEKLDNSEITWTYQFNSGSINNVSLNSLSEIREVRLRNKNRVLTRNLNINSIRNKLDQLNDTVLKYIDIHILTVTKLDETFLISQFLMGDFLKPYRLDRTKHGGGVLV